MEKLGSNGEFLLVTKDRLGIVTVSGFSSALLEEAKLTSIIKIDEEK